MNSAVVNAGAREPKERRCERRYEQPCVLGFNAGCLLRRI